MAKKRPNIAKDIKEAGKELKTLMREGLAEIAQSLIDQVMGAAKNLPPSRRLEAISGLAPAGVNKYKADTLDAMSLIALDTLERTRKELPKAVKNVRFALNIDRLPTALKNKLIKRNQLLIGKQISDLQKVIEFAYATNEDTTDSDEILTKDLEDSALDWLNGPAIQAGAELTASTVVNAAREAAFFDDKVLEEIGGFVFRNGDPVTLICQDLEENFGLGSGNYIDKNDPNLFRYTPPLHWNCKSWIEPLLPNEIEGREAVDFKPSTAALEDEIQFQELLSQIDNHENCSCHIKLVDKK